LKMVMLDSAELATRSANLAVGAGENMKKATNNTAKNKITSQKNNAANRKC